MSLELKNIRYDASNVSWGYDLWYHSWCKTSEHSSRMNSMRSASDNADEVISKLQLLYNRARQNVITTELIDIIGGANAIGGKE